MRTLLAVLLAVGVEGQSENPTVRYRVTGLYSPDREEDLRVAVGRITEAKLVSIDYPLAEATFSPDSKIKGLKPEQIQVRIANALRTASHGTFDLRPLISRENLEKMEIAVAGLDCKGCSLGTYWKIYKLPGVEQATVSFKEGRVVAWIDPARTNRAALEKALRDGEVHVKKD